MIPNLKRIRRGLYRIRWELPDANGERCQHTKVVRGSEDDAIREREQLLALGVEAAPEAPEPAQQPASLTVSQFLDKWWPVHVVNLGDKARARYQQLIESHLKPGLGHILLADLTEYDIETFYAAKQKDGGRLDGKPGGLDRGSVNYMGGILRQSLKKAVKWHDLAYNPADEVPLPKKSRPGEKIHPLVEEQVPVFLEHARGTRLYALFAFLLGSGCRPEEAYALEQTDVNYRTRLVTITKAAVCVNGKMKLKPIPKTSRSNRTLLLPETAITALREHLERQEHWKEKLGPHLYHDQHLIFANETGGYLDPGNVNRRYFKPILKAATLPSIRPYDLHTHATLMIINGKDLKLVSERLGHEDEAFTLKTYHHVIPRLEREAVELFDDIMAGRLSGDGTQRSSRKTLEELLVKLDRLLSGQTPPAPQPDQGPEDHREPPVIPGGNVIPFKLGSSSKKRSRIPLAQ